MIKKGQNSLCRIEKFDNEMKAEDIEFAFLILKDVLKVDNFCFYITKNGKRYRKENPKVL